MDSTNDGSGWRAACLRGAAAALGFAFVQGGVSMRRLLHLSVLAGALLAAGCGSETSEHGNASAPAGTRPDAAASATDPCSLVTAEEVGAIIGDKIVATEKGEGSCVYQTADAQASSVEIELNQSDAAGQMDIAKRTAGFLKGMGDAAAKEGGAAGKDVQAMLSESGDAPKVGDEAFFGPNSQLSVRKGASYVAILPPIMRSRMAARNPLLSADDKKKMAVAIAEKAVSRLP